ncbi:hydrolase [Streptomyces fumanus]|uniref:Hydrolase n=2 Tax=Streptomyces fumanus TaxID=67302 RepID=A0A919ADH0_9ACTN|nr:RICIN domain-containing protein [Streptomyces fumanus]GHF00317.1 hydrolase [Streptomyces fumanus]
MPTPHPPRPLDPPPGGDPGESDDSLAGRLRGHPESEAAHAVALLTARHWRPAHDYAAVCLATASETAAMVTAAAFRRVLDRLAEGEPAAALRPRLLVAVRDTVRQWAADERITGALPQLLRPAGGRGMRAAGSLIPDNRALAARAFAALPGPARCLLWHTEVEAEPLHVPAELLGLDPETAAATLAQARETFREGCVHAHLHLAPGGDCRFYNRLLDVQIRRGGPLLPDVQDHLAHCRHCRNAAEQLGHFGGGLGTLLAEAVLGWGARRYLDSRPGRAARPGAARHRGGRPGLLARVPVPARRAPGGARSARSVLRGVGAASAGVLVTALVIGVWSYDGGRADPTASTGAADRAGGSPGAAAPAPTGPAGLPAAPGQTRVRNAAAGLCLDVRGAPRAGAGARLAGCSAELTQQWIREDDGLLRSVADPGLCLDSRADAGVVVLGTCAGEGTGRGADVRYALTAREELVPRWDPRLALAPATGDPDADVVVRVRDGSAAQRWTTDPAPAASGSLSMAGTGTRAARPVRRAGAGHPG